MHPGWAETEGLQNQMKGEVVVVVAVVVVVVIVVVVVVVVVTAEATHQ